MNEIVQCWKNLENLDKEEELFQAYVRTRVNYDAGVRRHLKGDISRAELLKLYDAERNAFKKFETKTLERPILDDT